MWHETSASTDGSVNGKWCVTNLLRRVLAEERLQEVVERPLEIAERDPLVDREPLDLVERRRVRRIGRVASVDAAEGDDVHGRLLRLHRPDLRRRRLGAEHRLVVEEERLQRRARRMPGREVEGVEVVARRLDLAAVDDRVPEPEEDVLDLAPDLRDEVEVPAPDRRAGHRHVDALLGQPPVELGTRQLRLARVDRGLEPLAERVQRHPRLAVAHLAERELQLALPAEVLDADLLDLVGGRGRLDSCEGGVLECLGVHGSAEVTNRPCLVSLHEALEARSRRRTAASDNLNASHERLRGLRVGLRRVGGGHDGGRRLLRRARSRGGGPGRRARRRYGWIAIPIAERTARRVIGIDLSPAMLALARQHAADAGVELELREATCAISSSASRRRTGQLPVPGAAPSCRPGTIGDACSSASARALRPRRALRVERVRLRPSRTPPTWTESGRTSRGDI